MLAALKNWLFGKPRTCDLCGGLSRAHTVALEDVVICDDCYPVVVQKAEEIAAEPIPEFVELTPGYSWECPECEEMNWADEVPVEMTEQFPQVMRDEEAAGAQFVRNPTAVHCEECNRSYAATI